MSISSSSAKPRRVVSTMLEYLPVGTVVVVSWPLGKNTSRAVWVRETRDHIRCLLDSDNENTNRTTHITDTWGITTTLTVLSENEAARVTALIALGRGELV